MLERNWFFKNGMWMRFSVFPFFVANFFRLTSSKSRPDKEVKRSKEIIACMKRYYNVYLIRSTWLLKLSDNHYLHVFHWIGWHVKCTAMPTPLTACLLKIWLHRRTSHENIFKYYGNLFASVSLFQYYHGKSTMEFHGLRTLKLLLRHWNRAH